MPIDDMSEPESTAPASSPADGPLTPCEADIAFSSGVDSAVAARSWIDMAISILTADIDPGPPGTRERAAIEDLRIAAAERAARCFRSDIEPPGE